MEMMGAMMFSSAIKTVTQRLEKKNFEQNLQDEIMQKRKLNSIIPYPTDEDECQADAEGQDVTSERLVVLPVALCENSQSWIDVVFTQSLRSDNVEVSQRVS